MANINTVAVSGNLTRDPELRHTANGTAVCGLRIAVNRSRKQQDGSYANEASYFNLNVWDKFGELVAKKTKKGDAVSVQGRLESREWDAPDGTKRSTVEIVVDQLDGEAMYRKGGEMPDATPAQQQAAAAEASDDDIPF